MVDVDVWTAAAYRRTPSPGRLAWSEGWRPLGAESAFITWTEWTLEVTVSHDDSTVNTVLVLINIIITFSHGSASMF